METTKYYKNRGVSRNKKPLRNIIYTVEVTQLKPQVDKNAYAQYLFKDLGYLYLLWKYSGDELSNFHGFITPEYLQTLIGVEQYRKFCNGKRHFIIQRRVDGKNQLPAFFNK